MLLVKVSKENERLENAVGGPKAHKAPPVAMHKQKTRVLCTLKTFGGRLFEPKPEFW